MPLTLKHGAKLTRVCVPRTVNINRSFSDLFVYNSYMSLNSVESGDISFNESCNLLKSSLRISMSSNCVVNPCFLRSVGDMSVNRPLTPIGFPENLPPLDNGKSQNRND